jgi:hypothetical protein
VVEGEGALHQIPLGFLSKDAQLQNMPSLVSATVNRAAGNGFWAFRREPEILKMRRLSMVQHGTRAGGNYVRPESLFKRINQTFCSDCDHDDCDHDCCDHNFLYVHSSLLTPSKLHCI